MKQKLHLTRPDKRSKEQHRPLWGQQVATPQGAGTMYGALAAMHGALATAHVLAPQWASEFIFAGSPQPFDLVLNPLHRVLGTGHLAAAWSMWILKGAAEKEELHQKEYQRLNLGAVTFAAATLGVHAMQWDLLRPSAALTAGAIAGITAVAPAFYYSRTSGHGLRVGPIFQGIFRDLGNLLQIRGMKSAAYSVLTVGILGAGASYIALPYESLTSEASDAGRLHKPQFLDMNMGLAAAGLAHLIVLGPWWLLGHAGPLMPYILGTWATAFAAGTWGALGKRPVKQPKPI
ncbi:hypothetical protein COCOBI_04-1630 [Coccomyxa sp. Obi]|nr:hypothetical protein COCOBI_04-1630 [Coccomyxa sp. Obi]